MGGQGVVKVAQGDGGVLGDGLLETSGEAVAEIDANVLAPYVGMAGLVGVGGGDEERTGQTLSGLTEASAVACLDSHE